jgi:hypothetical protein
MMPLIGLFDQYSFLLMVKCTQHMDILTPHMSSFYLRFVNQMGIWLI